MSDFFIWFLNKHTVAAGLLFPELTFVWCLWMRHAFAASAIGAYIAVTSLVRLCAMATTFAVTLK